MLVSCAALELSTSTAGELPGLRICMTSNRVHVVAQTLQGRRGSHAVETSIQFVTQKHLVVRQYCLEGTEHHECAKRSVMKC
jgi:hypothetical protein